MLMDESTQQNAALVEQAAAASESIVGQATQLASLVARYDVAEDAAAAKPMTAAKRGPVPAAERRSPIRPWKKAPNSAATAAAATVPARARKTAVAGAEDWKEF